MTVKSLIFLVVIVFLLVFCGKSLPTNPPIEESPSPKTQPLCKKKHKFCKFNTHCHVRIKCRKREKDNEEN